MVAVLTVLIAGPLGAVCAQVLWPGLGFGTVTSDGGPRLLLEIVDRPLWQASLVNSLRLAGGTAVLGSALGAGLALLRGSGRFPLAGSIDVAAWVLLILPSFVIAQGWVLFAGTAGFAGEMLGARWLTGLVFSPNGLVVVMSLTNFPLAYLSVRAALAWGVGDLTAAARLCGAGRLRVLRTVRLPLLVPALASGTVLVFVDTLGDFGLPAALVTTYRFPTLPYAIFTSISQSPIRFDLAGVVAVYLTAIIGIAIFLQLRILRRSPADFLSGRSRRVNPPQLRHGWVATAATVTLWVVAIGIPVGASLLVSVMDSIGGGLDPSNLTMANYRESLVPGSRFRSALWNSLRVAAAAGLVSAIVGAAAAYLLTFSSFRLRNLIDATSTVTLAVPGVILGVGMVFIWNQPALEPVGLALYGRPVILVLAGAAGAVPIAVRVTLGAMAQVPERLLAAAALQGAGLTRRLRTILFPLISTALLSALLACFGTAVFDLAITTILRPPGYEILPYTVTRMFQQGYYGLSTAATILGAVTTVVLISTISAVGRRLITHRSATSIASEETQ